VRCVAFPPDQGQLLATGGMEKILRIFDLSRVSPITAPAANGNTATNGASDRTLIPAEEAFEVGTGIHKGTIKAIVWTHDPNILVTAADDKMIRWWDLRTRTVMQEQVVQGEIGSCEFTNVKPQPGDIGGGQPVLTIAAGKTVYFYGGNDARTLIKSVVLPYEVASVALHPSQRKFVTGGMKDTWAKVYNYDTEQELGMTELSSPIKSFYLHMQMYTKATTVQSGASASPPMASSTQLAAKTERSRCGRTAQAHMDCGAQQIS
jgi:serine-threonine kinase receptor-associated protein